MSSCCWACTSTQLRICCCSVRMWPTSAWMPSARVAIAAALRWCSIERLDRGLRLDRRLDGRGRLRVARQELLEFGIEAVLRLSRLQIEKAEDERAREAEQRGGERYAHAGDRHREAGLQVVEHPRGVGAGLHAVDDAADRMHRLEQAPEGAEQAEEDQQADQIAAELASLVEAGGDRIENGARRERREAARAGAGVEHRRHRREQERLGDRAAVRGPGQRVDPADLAEEPDDLTEREQRADRPECRGSAR